MPKKGNAKRNAQWVEAKRKCRLNAETLRMAKELGLNPRSLIKNIPDKAEPWKAPVHIWIREMYEKHQAESARRRAGEGKKQADNKSPASGISSADVEQQHDVVPCNHDVRLGGQALIPLLGDWPDNDFGDDESQDFQEGGWLNDDPPSDKEIAEQNELMLRRQKDFQIAAGRVAKALSDIPAVQKVTLFGSVAVPLEKKVPRFREFRKAGVAVWHECKDVDLAVWVNDLSDLKRLQRARSRALNDLLGDMHIGVAHHQVEMFILEPDTGQYLGRLCCFGQCPKGKPECDVTGCGATPFLQQHDDFTFRPDALASGQVVVLNNRDLGLDSEPDENEIPF